MLSSQTLTEKEKKILDNILEDLRFLFSKEEILPGQVEDVISQLKSDEVRSYLDSLRSGAKPEVALREAFLAGKAILTRYLFGHIVPEINIGTGFIDYRIVDAQSPNRFIVLELKSLFEADVETKRGVRTLKRIRQGRLKPELHKEQVVKYVREGGEFVVLTNLKEWFFYNDNTALVPFEPFHHTGLFEFVKDFEVIADFTDYLERREYSYVREGLDKKFFESLRSWVSKLSEVEFEVDDRTKMEIIIGIVNKFIFIQTLDDYGVVDFRWIQTTWDHNERRWHAKGKLQVLKKFLQEVMEFFWLHYDTELFQGEILEHIKPTKKNIELLYKNLQFILGIVYWQTALGGYRGVMQYKFRFIDEDIFGKAYETFLADVRHDEGIYYTPRYITEYIVRNTVERVFGGLLDEIRKSVEKEDFERVEQLGRRFVSIRVLDPACGSGSFLIKAIKAIWEMYKEIDSSFRQLESKYNKFEGTLKRPDDVEEKSEKLLRLREILGIKSDRELVSHIIIRHIHANDLDTKALAVAKVNVWLEAIKLAAKEFRYDSLPEGTNFVLPHLEMNFRSGDSVVGLPEDETVELLAEGHRDEVIELTKLRNRYLSDPTDPDLVESIEDTLVELRAVVDTQFEEYLQRRELPLEILQQTKPFHWALEFWYLYFDKSGEPLNPALRGSDVVLGNPPYERIQVLRRKSPST